MSAIHWARIGEAGSSAGLWLLYGLYRVGGRLLFRLIAWPVTTWYFMLRPVTREASLQYLRRLHAACGVPARRPGWWLALRHHLCFAESVLDKTLAISRRLDFTRVEVRGREHLHGHIAAGRGVILLTAHMGNLELCRVLGSATRIPTTVLVHTRHAERFNRLLSRLDPEHGGAQRVDLLQVSEIGLETAALLESRIAAGGVIVIAGDRVPLDGGRVTWADFLGHRAPFPIGPYMLASLLKCPVVLMFCLRDGAGYTVEFEAFRERVSLPRGERAQACAPLAQDYADRLARRCARAPLQWFNFFLFWDQLPHAEQS